MSRVKATMYTLSSGFWAKQEWWNRAFNFYCIVLMLYSVPALKVYSIKCTQTHKIRYAMSSLLQEE